MSRQHTYLGNAEPTTDELLSDPIALMLMTRDGLRPEHVRAFIKQCKCQRLRRVDRGVKAPDRGVWLLSA